MQEFQKLEKERLEEPPLIIGLEMLCATVSLVIIPHSLLENSY